MEKIIIIDTETTGSPEEGGGLWQLGGIIRCGKRREKFFYECDIFVDDHVSEKALETTGITMDEISKYADPGDTHDKFVGLLDKYVDKYDREDKFTVYAYGAEFDQKILRRWFKKNADEYFGSWFFHPWIDIMQLVAFCYSSDRGHISNFRLSTVAEYFGIKVNEDRLHNALYDALLTEKLYDRMMTDLKKGLIDWPL